MKSVKKTYDILSEIKPEKRPKVLLVGNGMTLPFEGAVDVDKIIQAEWLKNYGTFLPDRKDPLNHHEIWNTPLPLQVVIATKGRVDECMAELSKLFKASRTPDSQKQMIRTILDAGFDAVLTTNYSLEMEYSTIPDASEHKIYRMYKTTTEQTTQQEHLGIFQATELPYANNPLLWHIHGTALRKNSMVMGQFYYGKLLAEVVSRANTVATEYRSKIDRGMAFIPKSWIDYFLIGDVYCLGFGMNTSEEDIWWLLSLKKSAFKDSSVYFYDREPKVGIQKLLFDAYEIKCPDTGLIRGNDYKEFYRNVAKSLLT